jgi:lipopolysaccharide export system permease protein
LFSRLDKLVVKSFLGPFVVTFAISVFALMMQVLWLYLDDIAGKGLGFFTVVELMTYKCVGLVPLAMPLALLISSVMVLGGMAEHYELSSIKSAGTSLLRVMRPLVVFGAIGSMISFACADYIIPAANLQFGSRMYDIQKKKPTLNMEPGMFNEDFNQFAIRLGGRDDDGRHISDVLIYDHTKASTGDLGQITAATGEMYTENDGAVFVMKLYDGVQYSERKAGGKNRSALPFVRTAFESYTKVFDLSQFLMGSTAPELFKANRSMLATWQLDIAIDSIDTDIKIRKQTVSNQLTSYLPLVKRDTNIYKAEFAPKFKDPGRPSDTVNISSSIRDVVDKKEKTTVPKAESITGKGPTKKATRPSRPIKTSTPSGITRIDNTPKKKQMRVTETDLARKEVTMGIQLKRVDARNKALNHIVVKATNKWQGVRSVMDSLDKSALTRVLNRARSATRSISSQAQSAQRILPGVMESRVKHIYDLHMKYSMSLVCIIFIFIGAPMGAIVRKGGFGYPILVSIFFFVIFIILTIFCRKLAESFVVNGTMAGWLPCIILFPISLYITRTAMNDGKLVSLDAPKRGISIIKKAFNQFRKKMTS